MAFHDLKGVYISVRVGDGFKLNQGDSDFFCAEGSETLAHIAQRGGR